jgi:pimeloyl-ACP methyl ester carboxylesterase
MQRLINLKLTGGNTMSKNFLISLRNDSGGGNPGTSVGDTTYIEVEPGVTGYNLIKSKVEADQWINDIRGTDVLVFVHGFGNDADKVVERHDSVKANLPSGVTLVSFDWPSGNPADPFHLEKAYDDDKANAKQCAPRLIRDCFPLLLTRFGSAKINLFAHSMGAYVTENAFFQVPNDNALKINHVLMAAADVDRLNYTAGSPSLTNFLNRCADLTAYWSTYDKALQDSVKMKINKGAIPLGLQGYPDRPAPCRGIECSYYYDTYVAPIVPGDEFSHVWYLLFQAHPPAVNDFYADMADTIRRPWPTRAATKDRNGFLLRRPADA